MAHQATTTGTVDHDVFADTQYRCICCNGVIENLSEETIPSGLDLRLGLVADECALVCDACTARLIEAQQAQAAAPSRRK